MLVAIKKTFVWGRCLNSLLHILGNFVLTCIRLVFPEEVFRLREEMRPSPGVDRGREQWGRDVGQELSSLRGHITRAASLGNPEERCVRHGPRGANPRHQLTQEPGPQ